ncbi:MAG: putative Ig domain-containing protein [Desulfomonilaceae bacterium]|nr:putative Ig domain-containing protein [Desulfomonilaceae bacterium]
MCNIRMTFGAGRAPRDRVFTAVSWLTVLALMFFVSAVPVNDCRADSDRTVPPSVSDLRFEPERPETGEKIKLFLKLSNAIRAELRWSVNDQEVELTDYDGVSDHVVFDKELKAGDILTVSVTPFNSLGEEGKALEKKLEFHDSPPLLKLVGQDLKGSVYTAKVEAKDPEGESVKLEVEGPKGMEIDQEGNITWKMESGTQGKFPIKVTGTDEKGAQAVLTYSITIRRDR